MENETIWKLLMSVAQARFDVIDSFDVLLFSSSVGLYERKF